MSNSTEKTIILITGPLGSGKTTALRLLAALGHSTLDADEVAHEALKVGSAAYQQMLDRFGQGILDPAGGIDRLALLQAVRADPRAGADFRSILLPVVRYQVQDFAARAPGPLIFLKAHDADAYGCRDLTQQTWLLAPIPEERIDYLVSQHGWSREAAGRFVQSSRGDTFPEQGADLVLRGRQSSGELREQVMLALEALGWSRQLPPGASFSEPASPPRQTVAADKHVEAEPRTEPKSLVPMASPAATSASVIPVAATPAARSRVIPATSLGMRELRLVARRLVGSAVILLVIAFLTFWGLILAEYGREHLPIRPLQAASQAFVDTAQYITAHPVTYFWSKQDFPWAGFVGQTLGNSAGLLLVSMTAAVMLGFPLGMAAARTRQGPGSALMVLLSVAGASTPSFFLGMILWALNIWVHRTFDIDVLPATGFGWDSHLIMPALVLAMRPMAQIAQITYLSVREALSQDYVRTAHSKGLSWRAVQNVHLLPNVLIPILNTLGASLRFSLASLPIVEIFFHWPGVGMRLLDAIELGNASLVVDLILSLGLFFLLVNVLIEFSFPLIDPRLRNEADEASRAESTTPADWFRQAAEMISAWMRALGTRFGPRRPPDLPPLPAGHQDRLDAPEAVTRARKPSMLRTTLRNPAFVIGLILLLGLASLSAFGEQLSPADPYQVNGVMSVGGEYSAPPFKPSPEFAWGSDHLGRDMRALVLAGARRTMSLVFFGMLARILLGATFGVLAGWTRGSWFDRLVTGGTAVWAAFPATLFAMILIQALGIQQGMWVFVVAISVVGWGEVAQIVRAHVVAIKPQAFIDAGRSIGARADQLLIRHVLPNIVNPLTVLAALEMGGILMLLAELGFLNIFMGGGFRAIIAEGGGMVPTVATYSDVPEWSALIANVRQYWRSYPWMALYPGLAMFISIMSFNLFGEGLRRFLEVNAIGLGRFLNRYTLLAGAALAVALSLVLRSAAPLNVYRTEGLRFDESRVVEDVRWLSDPQLQGRETGLAGADLAAIYIAQQMAEIGLAPAGEHNSYYQRLVQPRIHLNGLPTMKVLDAAGDTLMELEYRRDFAEIGRYSNSRGEARAAIMGVAFGLMVEGEKTSIFGLSNSAAIDHIILVREADYEKVVLGQVDAVLVVADEDSDMQRRDVYPYLLARSEDRRPIVFISEATANMLLETAGSSLAELDAIRGTLSPGTIQLTGEGAVVDINVPADRSENLLDEAYINVMGVIPGQGYMMGTQEQVIVVGAYYDGLGTDPRGVVYPGANDNASGVGMMLELARLLKSSAYEPDKTVLFVAWAGGERQEGLSVTNVLNARPGASELTVEVVIELSGVGYGTGNAISIGNDSSYRLVQLFQEAAKRYDAPTTTLGRGPHYDLPVGNVFGGREATTLSVSWDGSDDLAHTPEDTLGLMDASKIEQIGKSVYLTLLVLSRETEY